MVFNVFSRPENVPVQLSHYSQSPAVADFVVIWAGPEPVLELSSQVSKPVHVIVPPDSSLNWRFYPWPEISRSCVIPMDDDWLMPLSHIERAVQIWHEPGYDDLFVGYEHLGRNHAILNQDEGGHVALYAPTFFTQYALGPASRPDLIRSPFHSILLPSGAVVNRRFLDEYSSARLAAARTFVSERRNCEDILLAFVVANATNTGPAIIRAWHRPDVGLTKPRRSVAVEQRHAQPSANEASSGLWHRTGHLGERSECLERFRRDFLDDVPLRYSTSYFDLEGPLMPRTRFHSQREMPIRFPCRVSTYERQGVCELVDNNAGRAEIGASFIVY